MSQKWLGCGTIDHDVLLWKLNNFIGIRGLPLKLLASYLQGRQQYTVIDGCTSATLNITQGVPQGSSLGPLLLAFYINDLPSTTKLTPTLFEDPNTVYPKIKPSKNARNHGKLTIRTSEPHERVINSKKDCIAICS